MQFKKKEKEPTKAIWVRVPKDQQTALESIADYHTTTVSEILRYLINSTDTIETLKNKSTEDKK
ncbi:MAG: hypothetical protein WD512_07220 [Candidatus Paceibacterota bacterium]